MVRHTDGSVKVLYNRCPHKGTKVAGEVCGNTGKFFRCPYHAWTFRTDGSLLSVPLKKGYENTGFESCEANPRHGAGARGAGLPRLRVLPAQPAGRGFRGILRPLALDHRQHDRPLARGQAGGRRRRAALHAPLQLEDAGRQPDRHLPSDGGARIVGRHGGEGVEGSAGGHAQADGGGAVRAVRQFLRVLREHGHPGLGQRPWPHRRRRLHPRGLFAGARLLGADGRRLRRRARQGHPRRGAPQHHLLSQHHGQGPGADAAPLRAARRRPHAGRVLDLPAGRRARPAAGAHAHVQPPDQRADLGGRA